MDHPAVVIAGPTCTGKSDTAVELAIRIGGEVVSADSMQVYRGMDIGTAKIPAERMRGVPHHMIDIADPEESMSVSVFAEKALGCIEGIRLRGRVPIIVGGTGFYIESILFKPPEGDEGIDTEYRSRLKKRVDSGELAHLYAELSAKDPRYAETVHPNNRMRIIRALEYIHAAGRPYSDCALAGPGERRFPFRCFVLDDDRRALYERIDRRVDTMVSDGLLEEVRALADRGLDADSVSMQGIGYRQMYDVLSGNCSMEDAVRDIRNGTHHIAKRQLTWFRHRDYCEWIDISRYGRDPGAVAEAIISLLDEGQGQH